MKIYLVGGAVRDRLLQQTPGDRDWVVVGATQADMEAQGYKAVGRDFPVFLHPHTGEEYALARTERKSGRGYRGFVVDADPSVTLEDDLLRRDFTINAIACDEATGTLVDPYAVRATSSSASCATWAPHSWKTRCGYCARRASWPALRRSVSPWPPKPWP